MSHSSLRYLFLHFGPGGNADLERKWLSGYKSKVDFWDQPKNVSSFKELVHLCAERYKVGGYHGIIGHSFGCDLALKIAELLSDPQPKLILISPLRDVPKAFVSLAQHLADDAVSQERKHQLRLAFEGAQSGVSALDAFTQLAKVIGADPLYYRRFWAQAQMLKAFEEVAAELTPLDMKCWQAVLADVILNYQMALNGKKAQVYIGSKDPYYGLIRDEDAYWKNSGADVSLIENAGHYPHLESDLFKQILGDS